MTAEVKSLDDARRRAGDVIQDEVNADIERKTGRPVATVAQPDPRFVADDSGYDARVPEGNYQVTFIGEQLAKIHSRDVWVIRFRVTDDYEQQQTYAGIELRMFLSAIPQKRPPRPGWALVSAYCTATERRPPADLSKMKPSRFLSDCVLEVRVRDVAKDSKGVRRPDAAVYSRVAAIVTRVAGLPPCLTERSRT